MEYKNKVDGIKELLVSGGSSQLIAITLNMKRHEFYNIVKREGIQYDKHYKGKQTGAVDTKPRQRRKKNIVKEGGCVQTTADEPTIRLYQPSEAEEFIKKQNELLEKQLSNLRYTHIKTTYE